MKNKILTLGLMAVFATLSISCNKKTEEPTATAQVDKEQIKKKFKPLKILLQHITILKTQTA